MTMTVTQAANMLIKSKATLILPCSADKLPVPGAAFDVYQGKGYMSVIRQWSKCELMRAFNVYFLSAKYGLIHSSKYIAPYEQKITKQRVAEFAESTNLRREARELMKAMNADAPVYVVLPNLYREALTALAGDNLSRFSNVHYAHGGIGEQRGQLKRAIESELEKESERAFLSSVSIEMHAGNKPFCWYDLVVSVGDTFRPWFGGCGSDARYSEPVRIVAMYATAHCDLQIIDSTGNVWSCAALRFGLTEEQIEAMSPAFTRYKEQDKNTLFLSHYSPAPFLALVA